jgi:hypothetical protein
VRASFFLDVLTIDAEACTASVVWRAVMPVPPIASLLSFQAALSGDFQPPMESGERALATLNHLVAAVGNALPQATDRDQRAREVAHQILAFCHGWAMLSATPLLD